MTEQLDAYDVPFERGRVFVRREIHDRYGGQRQGGISTPRKYPFIFVFSGPSGEQHGYRDGWSEEGLYRYTGEGQRGEMRPDVRGNRAILEHAKDGKDLLLFESMGEGSVRFVDQMICAGYRLEPGHDTEGRDRKIVVFDLAPVASFEFGLDLSEWWNAALSDLEEAAQHAVGVPDPGEEQDVAARSTLGRVVVLRRAGDVCDGCGFDAPFQRPSDRPYLEVHDLRRWTDAGPIDPSSAVALCPNCHARSHYGKDREAFNETLRQELDEGKASA